MYIFISFYISVYYRSRALLVIDSKAVYIECVLLVGINVTSQVELSLHDSHSEFCSPSIHVGILPQYAVYVFSNDFL